jgi:hypothetical protein
MVMHVDGISTFWSSGKKSMVAVFSSATRVVRVQAWGTSTRGHCIPQGKRRQDRAEGLQRRGGCGSARRLTPGWALIALWTRHLEPLSCHLRAWQIATCEQKHGRRSMTVTETNKSQSHFAHRLSSTRSRTKPPTGSKGAMTHKHAGIQGNRRTLQ